VHPVLLAALARWESQELERLLRLLETLLVRYQLIGGGRTGRLEISCAGLASSVYAGTVGVASADPTLTRGRPPYPERGQPPKLRMTRRGSGGGT